MPTRSVVVIGGSGFVGSSVCSACERAGWSVRSVPAPRLTVGFGADPVTAARAWSAAERFAFASLVETCSTADAIVNAAGSATPTSPRSAELWGANAVLPAVVVLAAQQAGCRATVHVSSAAVQGSQPVLDEQPFAKGHSPYAESKGAGELAFTLLADEVGADVTVYRPTSVLGVSRPIARRLAEVLNAGWLPLPRRDVPLPVAHIDSTGEAVRFLLDVPQRPLIALHPWEGMTVRSLATAFGRVDEFHTLPGPIATGLVRVTHVLARGGPLAGQARRLELLWAGQSQHSSLESLGFAIPDAAGAFERLGRELTAPAAR